MPTQTAEEILRRFLLYTHLYTHRFIYPAGNIPGGIFFRGAPGALLKEPCGDKWSGDKWKGGTLSHGTAGMAPTGCELLCIRRVIP